MYIMVMISKISIRMVVRVIILINRLNFCFFKFEMEIMLMLNDE